MRDSESCYEKRGVCQHALGGTPFFLIGVGAPTEGAGCWAALSSGSTGTPIP